MNVSGNYNGITYTSTGTCAGTLINRFTVLTAAHCIMTEFQIKKCFYYFCYYDYVNVSNPFDSSQYTVYLGVHNQLNLTQQPVIQMGVEKIIRVLHKFKKDTHNNHIKFTILCILASKF
jgi:V8-like Glu-specific endopeptidase